MGIETISSIEDLRPGDVGLGPIPGWKGWAARLGMVLLRDDTRYPHCFMVTSNVIRAYGHDASVYAVEAMPGGAREVEISDRWTSEYLYIRPTYFDDAWALVAARTARAMVGSPYGYMNYPYLALGRLGIENRFIDAYVRRETDGGLPAAPICSQLVDAALGRGGVQLFDDGRTEHDVTPGDIMYGLLENGHSVLTVRPGR